MRSKNKYLFFLAMTVLVLDLVQTLLFNFYVLKKYFTPLAP